MKIKQIIAITLIITMSILPLTACSTVETPPASPEPTPNEQNIFSPGTDPNPNPDDPNPDPGTNPDPVTVTVTDQAGRTVTIREVPQRIVSGYYISTSALMAIGASDRLVGIEARAASRPIYSLAAPELLDLPDVGTAREFNLEACLALEPDLVVLPIRLSDIASILEELGIPVILVSPESNEELLEMLALLGEATDTVSAAEQLILYYKTATDRLNRLTAALSDKPAVYICGVSSYLSTAPGDMYQSDLIEMAGGINAAAGLEGDSRQEISYEQLLVLDPDIIIIPPEANYSRDDIMTDPQLKDLTAVKTGMGRVYQMPSAFEAWDSPVPSGILGAKWLLCTLHSDIYDSTAMSEDAFEFYKEFYGIEIDITLLGFYR